MLHEMFHKIHTQEKKKKKVTSKLFLQTIGVWAAGVTHPLADLDAAALLFYLAAAFSSPPDDFTPRSMTPSLVLSGRLWKDAFSVPVSMVSV